MRDFRSPGKEKIIHEKKIDVKNLVTLSCSKNVYLGESAFKICTTVRGQAYSHVKGVAYFLK